MPELGTKRSVRDYYDSFGWRRDETGRYRDQSNDPRELLTRYNAKANQRLRSLLPRGRHLLDAGCGPILRPEQRELYEAFDFPVCVDFSTTALSEARQKVDRRVCFVQADVTMLPFRPGSFDAILSSHVLYHIPADEQARAIFDLYRVLAAGGTCVILYAFSHSTVAAVTPSIAAGLSRLRGLKARIKGRLRGPLVPPTAHLPRNASDPEPVNIVAAEHPVEPTIYFFAHDWKWLHETIPSSWDVEIRSWASLDTETTWRLFRDTAASRRALAAISWLEDHLPKLMARVGGYPMIVVRKTAAAHTGALPSYAVTPFGNARNT
jgi:SAM-dependent methyltransferase